MIDLDVLYLGVTNPHLYTIAEVSGTHFCMGDLFQTKDDVTILIVGEAMKTSTIITIVRSD